jgi:lipopolysaccharide/colanic/teichoic acid biosynthesis glycosyltransferase
MLQSNIPLNSAYLYRRRVAELLVILLLAPVLLLICLLTAAWISTDSPGGILFSQQRPGKGGRLFRIYKFRSMRKNVDSSFLTVKNDKRITRSGRFIRRYRIDELPQIFNVMKGEMSLIGPRPVPVEFLSTYEQHIPNYLSRHLIRPGITGLAQVRQGYTNTVAEEAMKLKYDLFYIQSVSLKMDMAILRYSLKALLSKD